MDSEFHGYYFFNNSRLCNGMTFPIWKKTSLVSFTKKKNSVPKVVIDYWYVHTS